MQFVREFLSAKGSPLVIPATYQSRAQRMSYHLSAVRWHEDTRPSHGVLAVHDILGSAKQWSHFVRTMAQLPSVIGKTTTSPLSIYSVDLRLHGGNNNNVAPSSSFCLQSASDAIQFQTEVITGTEALHLLGEGLGGKVCALAALVLQSEKIASLTILCPTGDVLGQQLTGAVKREKLMLLSSALKISSTLAGLNEALLKSIPNEDERLALLQHIRINDIGKLSLPHDLEAVCDENFVAWPSGEFAPSDAKFTGPVTVLHSSDAVEPANAKAFMQYFPNARFVKVPQSSFGGNAESDVELTASILNGMGLLSEIEQQPVGA